MHFVRHATSCLPMCVFAAAIQKGLEQAAEDESEGEDDRAPPEEPCGQEKKVGLPKASKGGKTPGVAATKVPEVSMGATSRPSVTYHVDEVVTAIMAQHAQVKQAAGSSTRVAQQAAPSSLTQAPIQTVDAPPSELVIAGAGMQATPAVGSRPAGNTGVDAGAAFIIDDADLTCTLELSRSSLSSSTSAATAAPPPQSPLQPPPPLQAAAADSLELAPPAVAPESAAATPTSTAPSAAAAATYSMLEAHPNTPQQHLSPAMAHPELLGASAPNPAAPTPRSSSRHDMAGGMVTHTDQQSTSGLRESVAGGVGSVEPLESPRLPEGDADGNAAPPEDATTDQAVCVGSVKLRRTLDDIAAAAVAAVDEVGSEKGADRWSDGDEGSSCCGRSLASNITFGMGVMQTPQPPAESASEPTVPASPAPTAEGPAASSIQCGAATGTNAAGAAGGDSGVPKAMCGADCPKMVGEAEGTPGGVPGVCMALPAPAPPSVVTVAGGEHNEGSSAFSFSLASHTPSDLPQGIMVQALGQEQQAQPPEDATLTPAAGTDGPCTRAPAMEAVVEQAEWQNTFKPWLPQPAPHPPPPPPPSLPSSGASSDPGPGIPPWQVPEGRPKATRRPTPQGPTLPAPASAPTLVPHPPPLAHQQQQSGRHHGQQDPASRLLAQPRPQLQHVDSTLYDKTFGEGARDRDGGIRISGPSLVGADVVGAREGPWGSFIIMLLWPDHGRGVKPVCECGCVCHVACVCVCVELQENVDKGSGSERDTPSALSFPLPTASRPSSHWWGSEFGACMMGAACGRVTTASRRATPPTPPHPSHLHCIYIADVVDCFGCVPYMRPSHSGGQMRAATCSPPLTRPACRCRAPSCWHCHPSYCLSPCSPQRTRTSSSLTGAAACPCHPTPRARHMTTQCLLQRLRGQHSPTKPGRRRGCGGVRAALPRPLPPAPRRHWWCLCRARASASA